MSLLFEPLQIGNLELANRLVCSATYEGMAQENGKVSDELIKKYVTLSKGEVGLSITGMMYVQPSGRGYKYQSGIHDDEMTEGLKKLADAVQREGGKIVFQLAHSGRQTTKGMAGRTPMGPSSRGRDPVNFVKPKEMTENDIQETIKAFGLAADRAVQAGADGIQLHAAHGYLICEFLSPFYNIRKDSWGGSDQNRFRFLEEIYHRVRKSVPDGYPVCVELNTNDFTPEEGITPSLSMKYARWLVELGVDAIELSCGSTHYSYMNMCRGDVPTQELVQGLSWWEKPIGKMMISKLEGKYDLEEGYNLKAAKMIKPHMGNTPLILVGGVRTVAYMEEILKNNFADAIAMSRPFIREPFLAKKIKAGKIEKVSCVSCNRCLAAVPNHFPVSCYNKAFPKKRDDSKP